MMEIEEIRRRVAAGQYLIKSHAVRHALKEGFERGNIIETISNGKVIENYLSGATVFNMRNNKLDR